MADGRHLEKSKNGHIYAAVQAIDTKFAYWLFEQDQQLTFFVFNF